MIDMSELKPILEPLDLPVETLEAIQAIDRDVEVDTGEIDRLKGELETAKADYETRFRNAFFKGEGVPHDHEEEVTTQVDEQTDEKELATTYEELFGEENV